MILGLCHKVEMSRCDRCHAAVSRCHAVTGVTMSRCHAVTDVTQEHTRGTGLVVRTKVEKVWGGYDKLSLLPSLK